MMMTKPNNELKQTLALAMIVKNEANSLERCLNSVLGLVDEIVIVDSGSTDETPQIAAKFKAKFITNTDWQGFGKQRQIAQKHITCDYVLWLDADEELEPALKTELLTLKQQGFNNHAYFINRLSSAFGKFVYHSGWNPDWLIRLYPTNFGQYNDALVHEKVSLKPEISTKKLKARILHYTYSDLHSYLRKTINYVEQISTDKFNAGKKGSLLQATIRGSFAFFRMYILKRGFLDGRIGFTLAVLTAFSTWYKYAGLWIKNNNHKNNRK